MKVRMKRIANVLFWLSVAAMLASGTAVLVTYYQDFQEKRYWDGIAEAKKVQQDFSEGDILPEYRELYEQNQDLIGWITIENTTIDYPVMQNKEEPEYYLRRNFSKEDDSLGTPFADYRCEVLSPRSFNVIIYGHYTSKDAMFRWLLNYASQSWYAENKIIQFDTLTEKGVYEVVAAFFYDGTYAVLKDSEDEKSEESYEFYNYIELDDAEGYQKFLSEINKRKLYDTEESFDETDELLTLVCCAPEAYSGMEENGRFVVVAKRVEQE